MSDCRQALFLDRDGTLIVDKHYLSDPEGVEIIAGTAEALRAAREHYQLFLFTNQSGINRGWYSLEDVCACNQRMLELMDLPEDTFTDICIAPEAPGDTIVYRKPSPRFLLESIERHGLEHTRCYMVGDRESDLQAGLNADINPIALRSGKSMTEEREQFIAEHKIPVYDTFADFWKALAS